MVNKSTVAVARVIFSFTSIPCLYMMLLRMRRTQLARYEKEAEELQEELTLINEQSVECQAAYDALAAKDRYMDRTFKNNFADLSPVIVEQCYKYFK